MEARPGGLSAERPPWLARVRGAGGGVAGAGFLVGERQVLTCAHVAGDPAGSPPAAVEVEFPAAPGWRRARVADDGWQPARDVAVLEVEGGAPGGRPAPLARSAGFGREFRACGFPARSGDGAWVRGTVSGAGGPRWEWVQLDDDTRTAGRAIERGFSGAPVWDDHLGAVIGMVVARDPDHGTRTAFMIPTAGLVAAWPPLAERVRPAAGLDQALLALWPPPRVAEASPYDLGVLNSARARHHAPPGGEPPYVPRERDHDLRDALRRAPFVLVTGQAHAGKSRTAFEAARAELPDRLLLVPRDREALARLAGDEALVAIDEPVLIWLDDLERYLAPPGGLDRVMLAAWERHPVPVTVLATIRLSEQARLRKLPREVGREARAVLATDEAVLLPAEFRGAELGESQRLYGGEQLGGGLGRHLAAAHELEHKLREGRDTCPEGYAVVLAALAWRRLGLGPVRRSDLRVLARECLRPLQPLRPLGDEGFASGLAWATEVEAGTAALLAPDGERFAVTDGIADALADEEPVDLTDEVLELADRGEALKVGLAAFSRGDRNTAARAWSVVIEAGEPGSAPQAATYLGHLFAGEGDTEGAIAAYRQAAGSADPEAAPTASLALGRLLATRGDAEGAIAAYRQAAGSGHPEAPTAALQLGDLLADRGDQGGAATSYRQAAASRHPAVAALAATHLERLEQATGPAAKRVERRTVSVLLADLPPGSRGRARTVVERHGGSVQRFVGDAMVAAFGLPEARDDDALRAVRAAVALRDLPAATAPRVWVQTGESVVGAPGLGGPDTVLLGGAFGGARQLDELARPGDVLLDEATHATVGDAVGAESMPGPPGDRRGWLWRLTDLRTGERREPPSRRLIGRDLELAALRLAYQRAATTSRCHLAIVSGAAGVGKTYLALDLVATLPREARVLATACPPAFGDEAVERWPLAELLRKAAGVDSVALDEQGRGRLAEVARGNAETAARLATLLEPVTAPLEQEAIAALAGVLARLARERPLVVMIDELHQAGGPVLDFLRVAARRLYHERVLLLCLTRPELPDRVSALPALPNSTVLELAPLSQPQTEALVADLLGGGQLSRAVRDRVWAASGGQPLIAEVLVRQLIDQGELRRRGDRWSTVTDPRDLPIPATVRNLLSAHLLRLDTVARHLIERAAVAGPRFRTDDLVALSPDLDEPAITAALETLVREDLIKPARPTRDDPEPTADYAFYNGLILEAAYMALPDPVRRRLHRRFADWLTRTGADPARIARHRASATGPAVDSEGTPG